MSSLLLLSASFKMIILAIRKQLIDISIANTSHGVCYGHLMDHLINLFIPTQNLHSLLWTFLFFIFAFFGSTFILCLYGSCKLLTELLLIHLTRELGDCRGPNHNDRSIVTGKELIVALALPIRAAIVFVEPCFRSIFHKMLLRYCIFPVYQVRKRFILRSNDVDWA